MFWFIEKTEKKKSRRTVPLFCKTAVLVAGLRPGAVRARNVPAETWQLGSEEEGTWGPAVRPLWMGGGGEQWLRTGWGLHGAAGTQVGQAASGD